MTRRLTPAVAQQKLEDLFSIALEPGENPYAALIKACHDNPDEIQAVYAAHRGRCNALQKAKLLAPDFKGLLIDQHLLRLEHPQVEPGFRDERNCLVFWARPPDHVLRLASKLQDMLKKASPKVWLMPTHRMHLTTLEVAFSRTPDEIHDLLCSLRPSIPSIVNYTHSHRARLVKPLVSYDTSAFALSFLPACREPHLSPPPTVVDTATDITHGDAYTYHHVRRDLFDMIREAGVDVASRYQVPSAHITLGRHLTQEDHDAPEKRKQWVRAIEEINSWLETELWDREDAEFAAEWVVGQEKGLDARTGLLWYGGGRTVMMGEGF